METQTGNTYISKSMINITEIRKTGVFDHCELEERVHERLQQRR